MKSDSDLGWVPVHDFYYLGKLDMTRGNIHASFLPTSSAIKKVPHLLTSMFSTEYNPRGFADMMFLDEKNFDRAHYKIDYVRREFLGDVRCIVADVLPLRNAGQRAF